jgi:hypothetical protein
MSSPVTHLDTRCPRLGGLCTAFTPAIFISRDPGGAQAPDHSLSMPQ